MFSRLATRTAVQARAVTQVARLTVPAARLLTTSSARASSERMRAAQAAYRALEKKQREVEALRPPPRSTRGPVAAQEPEAQEEEEDEAYPEDEMYDDEYDDEGYPGEGYPGEQPIAAVTRPAPEWTATALMPAVEGAAPEFKQLSSNDFLGKWQVLFFYPLDFTFVCPTEIRAFSDRFAEFEKLGASVIACSVDSEYSHLAWTQMAKTAGGLGPMKIPILSDITKSISRSYGVLLEEKGIALRGLFIIDPEGILRQATVNDLPIGRSVDETLRLLQAFQYHAEHGEVCPAGWAPGKEAMQANPAGLKKYFERK